MLVLTRKLNEAIVVDGGVEFGGVEIRVLAVQGNRIRLGIQAPKSVAIRRGELPPLPPATSSRLDNHRPLGA